MTSERFGYQQAAAQMESISKMVAALQCDYDTLAELQKKYDCMTDEEEIRNWPESGELEELKEHANGNESADDAQQAIQNAALSIEVRCGWTTVGSSMEPEQFRIVLCTGGPHVEIRGDLDEHNEPSRAYLHYSDWGESGDYFGDNLDSNALLTYAQQFYFGE